MAIKIPKISIIFPSYNGEKFLSRNLDSIKNLVNLDEIELIIVDNSSIDKTIQIISSYNEKINLTLIKQNKNLGFAEACNIGAEHAKGEFLFLTNQDVIFPSQFFYKLLDDYYKYKKQQEIVISPAVIYEGNGIHYFGAKIHFLGFSYTPDILQTLPENEIFKPTQRITGCTFFLKKELYYDIGGFDSNFFMYCEDSDISLRIIRRGLKIYTTNKPYLIHQKHRKAFSDLQYFLLERNRFIVFVKNISNFKKLIPFFIIIELLLFIQSIFIKKLKIRTRIYYELFIRRNYFKRLRMRSRQELPLIPYQTLSRSLDPSLLENLKNVKVFRKALNLLNILFRII